MRRVSRYWKWRPSGRRTRGERLSAVEAELGRMVLAIIEGDQRGQTLALDVPADLKMQLNGSAEFEGHPVALADLRPGDQVELTPRGAGDRLRGRGSRRSPARAAARHRA